MMKKTIALIWLLSAALGAVSVKAQEQPFIQMVLPFFFSNAATNTANAINTASCDPCSYASGLYNNTNSWHPQGYAVCFASGQDDATAFTFTSANVDTDSACREVTDNTSGNLALAVYLCRNQVLDTSVNGSVDMSEAVAVNSSFMCAFAAGVAAEGATSSIAVSSNATSVDLAFTAAQTNGMGQVFCYATRTGATDRTYTWSTASTGWSLAAEDVDADVENVTRTQSVARFSYSNTTAGASMSPTFNVAVSGTATDGMQACIFLRGM